MNWRQLRQRHEHWFQGWLVLAPIVGLGSTTLVKNQLYRVWKVTHGLQRRERKGWSPRIGLVRSGTAVQRLWCSPCSMCWLPERGHLTPQTTHPPMIDFRRRLGLNSCLLGTLVTLASCEGATYVNQHFTNRTDRAVQLGFRASEADTGWNLDTVWTIEPGATWSHYALDFMGKCHNCTPYEALPFGIDSLWLEGQTLTVDLTDSLLWTAQVDEGLSWIRFDQRLDLVSTYFE